MSESHRAFGTAFDVAEAIETALSEAASGSRTIRPDLVALKIIQEHPELDLGETELRQAVVEAVARSGLSLQVLPSLKELRSS